ncbi:MAG: hypothetical protein CMP65_03365 [Flavobacteriales bacterium]|nr:hypothetical protein [Flavobacteriales bacterium]
MKTKISLSIIGSYNTFVAIIMMFFSGQMVGSIVNSDITEVVKMCEIMHYGLAPAILIIGLMLILCRNASLEIAKNLLLAYIIGTLVLMYVFLCVMSNEPLMNFNIYTIIPDILMLIIAIFGYIKAK